MTIPAPAPFAGVLVFAFTMIYAGVTDLTTYKIQNSLLLPFLLAYAVLAPFAGFTAHEIGLSAAVAAGVLLGGFMLFARGWIGGGDAKLAAATALWFGADHTLAYLLGTAVVGSVLTLAILQFRVLALPDSLKNRTWIARLHSRGSGVPYGVAMAVAALLVFPHTRRMTALF
jgi:prepilin peptidase CpaA